MAGAIHSLERAGYLLSTERRSSDLYLRIRYSSQREGAYGRLGGIQGGYNRRCYAATATLTDIETGILVSNGVAVASYDLDARIPTGARVRQSIFGGIRISGRSIRIGGSRATRDMARERATTEAVRKMIAKAQARMAPPVRNLVPSSSVPQQQQQAQPQPQQGKAKRWSYTDF